MNNKMIKIKKAAKVVLAVLLTAIALVNLLTIVFSSLGLRKQLKWIPCAFLTVTSGSMEPEISAGDMILVYETPYEELKIGDYVTYFNIDGGFTTHELIRRGETSFETKGLANDRADDSVNRGAYCAKVIAVFPAMGVLLDIFTKPIPAILSILAIVFLFYGIPYIKARRAAHSGNNETLPSDSDVRFYNKNIFSNNIRNLIALAMSSVFACTPFMTAARYVSDINEFAPMQAAQVNFTSNYMSQISIDNTGAVSGGNKYDITGWDASSDPDKKFTLKVEVNNFNNPLRFNTIDVSYVLYIEPVAEDGYIAPNKYVLTLDDSGLEPYRPTSLSGSLSASSGKIYDDSAYEYHRDISGNIWTRSNINGPYLLEKSEDQKPRSEVFELGLSLASGVILNPKGGEVTPTSVCRGDKVKFRIMSCTNYKEQFYHELKGEFTIEIADSDQFLVVTKKDMATTTTRNSILSANIQTNLVGTGDERTVYIYWDAERMYLDELEPTAANAIIERRNSYYNGFSEPKASEPLQKKGIGYLKIPMQAKSDYTFQYIKENEYLYESLVDYISIGETELTYDQYEGLFPLRSAS